MLQAAQEYPELAHQEVREGQEDLEDHQVPGLPSVQEHQYVHHHLVGIFLECQNIKYIRRHKIYVIIQQKACILQTAMHVYL